MANRIPRNYVWERVIGGKEFRFEASRNRLDNGNWYEFVHVFVVVNGRSSLQPTYHFRRVVLNEDLLKKLSSGKFNG